MEDFYYPRRGSFIHISVQSTGFFTTRITQIIRRHLDQTILADNLGWQIIE